MTAADRDPLTIAREVLEREERLSAYSYSIPLAAQASWDATRSEQVRSAPDLARAVIRLADLADDLDEDAVYVRNAFNGIEGRRRAEERRSAAARIRDALNGENHD